MSGLDEAEYRKLSEIVADTEQAINEGKIPSVGVLADFVRNAKQRMGLLEAETNATHSNKKDRDTQMHAVIVAMVERETRLSATEQQTYATFLEKDYFTLDDLAGLERFYADGGAFDRLSEKGKEQMGIRLEESIRRGEIEFAELSENMQKKHSEWIYSQLSQGKDAGGMFASLSAENRATFMREHEAGNYGAASKILTNKGSFDSQHVENQPASDRRIEAGDASAKNSGRKDSDESDKEKASDNDTELLASIGKNPTELGATLSGSLNQRS